MSPDEQKIYLNDPWLYDRLEWLLEHRPKLVERLFLEDKGKLLQLLCEKVKEAWLNEQAREKRGQDPHRAADATFEEVISPPSESRPRKQLPEEFQQKLKDWLLNLPSSRPQTETTDMNNEKDERKCDLLIVDDEPNIRWGLEKYFKQEIPGIKIELAEDGEEGYRLALEFRPRIVWTCIRMPRLNGLELIKLIKKNPDIKNAKIIVYSGYGSKETKNQAFELGADAFFDKPGNLDDMLTTVANFLK